MPGVAVLKHNNPCGAATAQSVGEATRRAWDGDPVSAFGSILGYNAPVDAAAAEADKSFFGLDHKAIEPDKKSEYLDGLNDPAERERVEALYADADEQAGRDVLAYAVRFPLILVAAFGLIWLYFRSKGGYKPKVLTE